MARAPIASPVPGPLSSAPKAVVVPIGGRHPSPLIAIPLRGAGVRDGTDREEAEDTNSMQSRRSPVAIPFVPAPLQGRVTTGEFEVEGLLRGFHLTWRYAEGRRCARCPASRCNLEMVPDTDTATCFVILRGEASDRFAAEMGLET